MAGRVASNERRVRTDDDWRLVIKLLKNGDKRADVIEELVGQHGFPKGAATSFVGSISCVLNALEGRSKKKEGIVYRYAQYLMDHSSECPELTETDRASTLYVDKVFSIVYPDRRPR